MYDDQIFSILYSVCQFPLLWRRADTGTGVCTDAVLLSGGSRQDSGKSRKRMVGFLDYEGSRLYDEYPDKFMLYQLCRQIRAQVESEMKAQGVPDGFLDELIQVLLCQEICRRRCRRHRYYLSREDIHFYK